MPEDVIQPTASRPIKKLLVANRSEIAIRVFRSSHELGIRTVAIYAHEDRFALHRFKADEAYRVGTPGEPLRAYLDIPAIVALATQHGIDAIHPGYGFLSENARFAEACRAAGVIFVGPNVRVLEHLGDKLAARRIAHEARVPILSGSDHPLSDQGGDKAEARKVAKKLGYPVIVKAAMGGGGRGMRVVHAAEHLDEALEQAQREAGTAFGVADVFLEKFVRRARHIEVQLLGDRHGNLVHLFERDCSLQRRHQKVVEIAPAPNLDADVRRRIWDAALAVGRAAGLDNAGTVEFLFDVDTGQFYFIEVNPRIQVEHTVTEEITGHDLIRTQILIAEGRPLSDPDIGLGDQTAIQQHGFALQCRVTTEDPSNKFIPDYGRLSHYRSASGLGIRLDAGSAFTGAVITPFYDSLLVKVTAHGLRFVDAARRMERCLQEFRIRGVKTNIPFLINLVNHPSFLAGKATTSFIDETPALFQLPYRQDRATRVLTYVADIIVNGHPEAAVRQLAQSPRRKLIPKEPAPVPALPVTLPHQAPASTRGEGDEWAPRGTRNLFEELGHDKFLRWIHEHKRLLLTDTTFRDAHQSLLATRLRTYDMLRIAPVYARWHAGLFSLEMWGGATFDTAMRFLKEDPWQRLEQLRRAIPNILFQMLLRANNAVGYANYPDNLVKAFIRESAAAGIDVFRIFDALNWLPNMKLAVEAVRASGKLAEAALCYTGDILDKRRDKFSLKYYVELAKELEKMGASMLGIKDMAGLCKPYAAQKLVRTLKDEIGLPIHVHTHDSGGGQLASLLLAAEEGANIVDAAMGPLSGMTSQVNLNTLVECLRFTPRDPGMEFDKLQQTADYWHAVRKYYLPFESGQLAPSADVYLHEMPGGQTTNLHQQAQALGIESRWAECCRMYAEVNRLFGDIVKVTPTSKVVGDMALFMVANNLTPADVLDGPRELTFPESVVEFFEGKLGQPAGGFPKALQKRVLRDRKPMKGRPGAQLPPADIEGTRRRLGQELQRVVSDREAITHLLYPRVAADFQSHLAKHSDVSVLPSPVFFYGMDPGDEIGVDIEEGKTLIIKFLTVGDPHLDGRRLVFFELNGQPREVLVVDRSLSANVRSHPKAEPNNPLHIAAPMPGLVVRVNVAAGERVTQGQKLITLEAMKMETTVYAEKAALVEDVLVRAGTQVEAGDLMVRYQGQ
ncbi:MAG: pyruvate carboxylase [Gemmataceae bacterium]|nr:pyruvate carboxylase [Gemmataceae bacterium]